MGNFVDHSGERHGSLVILGLGVRYERESRCPEITWLCRCDCGKEVTVRYDELTRKNAPKRSCGHELRGRICIICGKKYDAKSSRQNICSEECRAEKKRRKTRQWNANEENKDRRRKRLKLKMKDPLERQRANQRYRLHRQRHYERVRQRERENTRRRIESGQHQAGVIKRRQIIGSDSLALTEYEKKKIAQFYRVARALSRRLGIPHEVDHIIPLSKGGSHHPANLQILPRDQNRKKGDSIIG